MGTISPSSAGALNAIFTNMPGESAPPAFTNSTRAFNVRVLGLTSGRMACTLPLNTVPGTAGERASTAAPMRNNDAWLSGTSAFAHTVARPLMRNSVAPGMTVIPSRASSSTTTPPMGAVSVMRGCTVPLRSTSRICSSLIPA